MRYYPNTITAVRKILRDNFLGLEAKEGFDNLPAHLLWMTEKIESMMGSESAKAGRWIGYVLRGVEGLGLLTNEESRNFIRKDVATGNE